MNGADAAEFNPSRWATQPPPPPPLTYGHGAHGCVGRHIVRLFARTFVRELLLGYKVELESDGNDGSTTKWLPVSRPRETVQVRVTRLSGAP